MVPALEGASPETAERQQSYECMPHVFADRHDVGAQPKAARALFKPSLRFRLFVAPPKDINLACDALDRLPLKLDLER